MDEREQLQDLENHRHEDEFSPACELHDIRGCRRCLPSICDVEGHFNSDWVQDCCECHGSGRTWNVDNGEVECGSCEGTGGYCLKCGGTVETNDGDVDTLPQMNMLEHASMEMLAGRVLSNEQAQAMRKRLLLERAVSDMLEGGHDEPR